ncbi:MAG: hypothetical protein A3G76_03715 [Acidobacteria bacterium RIFCSPLOWO2_12_FULL_65_11]|nr:MAG: hypothetical protein A3H95_07390 [Acidobacteria bacterium RIFCSPLOWO2_02_FULL_64_15]OFW30035.1 MAG: hypothetical protein A3G76_03715 [Acidobacteria bacterium RIFCSPLOWO2_12_FULL_65_11]
MVLRDQLDIRVHAAQRMLERNISVDDVLVVLNTGATIEEYPDDTPYPSRLTLGWVAERPVHVVWATAVTGRIVVITVYEPDSEEWDNTFRRRRT